MTSDDARQPPGFPMRSPGVGLLHTWQCLGCRKPRMLTGSRGAGIRKRCAACVQQKAKA